jgi:two-component system, NarL family, invasion response regulator UvrY
MRRLRVLLVDDHAVVRAGYRHLLAASDGIEVVGEAADGVAAYRLFCELEPDVVVMDIALPGVSGIETMRRMRARRAHARILVFSIYEDAIYVTRALQAGSNGYLTKASAPEALVCAVRAVANGERYLSPDVRQALTPPGSAANCAHPLEALSAREFEVLGLLVQGLSLARIGERLGLSGKTVANYQSTIRAKLGAENDFQLARLTEQFRCAAATVDGGRG